MTTPFLFNRFYQMDNRPTFNKLFNIASEKRRDDNLLAGRVLVPDMNPDGSYKVGRNPYSPQKDYRVTSYNNVSKDYPQLPEIGERPYRAFGLFGPGTPGSVDSPDGPVETPDFVKRGQIRGIMNFVPGGVPQSPGFNYDETLKNYPKQMQGIPRGNMPVYYSN